MAFVINDKVMGEKLANRLQKARAEANDSLEKLSTGQVFTSLDPRPSERALAEGLETRLRSLASSKRNINDAVSLLQTAESSLSEINNMVTRMKEINLAAASTTLTDRDRRYLFVEYQALHDEINRVALTTEFNGIPLLNGESEKSPGSLVFHIGDVFPNEDGDDINAVRFEGLEGIVATTSALGIKSAADLLLGSEEEDGIQIEDAEELMVPDDDDIFSNVYDMSITRLSTQRAIFGAMQERLHRAMDFNDVYAENIAAAKSKIADTDYAREVTDMAYNNILVQSATGLLAQNNINANHALNLIASVLK